MSTTPSGFRTTTWNPIIIESAKAMYKRLRLGDPELPKWSKLDDDSRAHYCIAAEKAVEAFHWEGAKMITVWRDFG